jgi:hypothetical protein
MGQQTWKRNAFHPAMGPEQVKNSKSRFQTNGKIPSENEGKSSDFAPYGMPVYLIDKSQCKGTLLPAVFKGS